ncbi:MAG: GatB/YqeY domain-containing protein [Candidatus Accumulibacter sp.]|jgi:uncharacterized protein YqeY|nr:GatB/YqeY domain-containing protein [Accumulibacter sp.]
MTLKERITEDIKSAMRAREAAKRDALRLLLAAVKQKEVDERVEADDVLVVSVVEKLMKQRREAVEQYEIAGRKDRADAERFEADVLSVYLPTRLSPEELDAHIAAAVAETGARSVGDMGRLMSLLKSRIAGRADMSELSKRVRALLSA